MDTILMWGESYILSYNSVGNGVMKKQISAHSWARQYQCMTCSCWICHQSHHLHLESSKQKYYIISLWVITKAIFIQLWVCADTYLRLCTVQPLHQRHLLRHKIVLLCRTFRRAKSGFRGGVLAATTAVGRSAVLWVRMCQIIFHHSQGILRLWHMAYLGPGTHNTKSSAPNHPSRDTAQVEAQRKREYPEAKEDSKNGGDRSPQRIVNMWAIMWGSKRHQVSCVKVHDDGCLGMGCVLHPATGLCVTFYNLIKKSVIEYKTCYDWIVRNIL